MHVSGDDPFFFDSQDASFLSRFEIKSIQFGDLYIRKIKGQADRIWGSGCANEETTRRFCVRC